MEITSKAGNFDANFADGPGWPEIAPGFHAAVGVYGEPAVGPVMLLLVAEPGAELGGDQFDTELLHIVVDGSGDIGDEAMLAGDLYMQPASVPYPGLVAGSEGVSVAVLVGDRSRLGAGHSQAWAQDFCVLVKDLTDRLTVAAAPSSITEL
jgi:hypothetical protein